MRLRDISASEAAARLIAGDINIDLGVAAFGVQSALPDVQRVFYQLYGDYELLDEASPADFRVAVQSPKSLRRWYKPQIHFLLDDFVPFLPLPRSQAYPVLEWGMNWCMASHMHKYLLLHGAVLEKDGKAIIFPAPPGSGKSTLTAYLAHTGWRLLSDEMTVINLETGLVHPFVRPICLKNNSIDLVKSWFPDVSISNIARDTNKGDVAHVKPPIASVDNIKQTVKVMAVVLPKYTPDVSLDIYSLTKADAFQALSDNAFNDFVLGADGFLALQRLVENTTAVEIHYNDLAEVLAFLNEGQFSA
ncbi:HprK-related kinase A [Paraglaciecola chathamensis]|uniref:HPr kinase n=1 Tax=Paraglaciecola chathamensis S18K6 TaxID=1127672 RepID=A0AAV3V2G1_9ALTE|nr:HprK-related kinase A [Paraglaciecola chathamensis]GAC10785.1 HPr kinase [Paraglaciecola chathamensis S18K6]